MSLADGQRSSRIDCVALPLNRFSIRFLLHKLMGEIKKEVDDDDDDVMIMIQLRRIR